MNIVGIVPRNLTMEVENPAYQRNNELWMRMKYLNSPGKELKTENRMCNNIYTVSYITIKTKIRVLRVYFEVGSSMFFLNGNLQENI